MAEEEEEEAEGPPSVEEEEAEAATAAAAAAAPTNMPLSPGFLNSRRTESEVTAMSMRVSRGPEGEEAVPMRDEVGEACRGTLPLLVLVLVLVLVLPKEGPPRKAPALLAPWAEVAP